MTNSRKQTIVRSAMWAAYGDALGFITELADQRILKQRLSTDKVTELMPWTRRIGGRFGVDILLPSGCYSDDTQLRLATSRAIQATGEFDVEAFSKVELTVWISYALGAGRGTKLAAGSLARKDSRWFSNFYSENDQSYVASGGNGAAMRIQPHVWAARTPSDPKSYLPDVIRNAISTHGHPRAITGAVLHAMCLAYVLEKRAVLSPQDLRTFNSWTKKIPKLIGEDSYLRDFWIPRWEDLSKNTIANAFNEVFEEIEIEISKVDEWFHKPGKNSYEELVARLDLKNPSTRGSGTQTALAAAALSMLSSARKPTDLLLSAANLLGTDTDSIASMAGALIGATTDCDVPQYPQDSRLIEQDAARLYQLSQVGTASAFSYPGLVGWVPPRSAVDAVIGEDGKLFVAGLGPAEPLTAATPTGSARGDYVYQWIQVAFGQRLFIKRRSDLTLGIDSSSNRNNRLPADAPLKESRSSIHSQNGDSENTTVEIPVIEATINDVASNRHVNLDDLTNEAIHSGFDPSTIGTHVLQLADSSGGIESVIAYSAIIAKARISRVRRSGGRNK